MIELVKKYFIPNEKNDYKPHILRKASVATLSFLALFIFFLGTFHVEVIERTSLLSEVIARVLVDKTNTNRVQNSLNGLTINPLLEKAAQEKANDMAKKGYFAHTSPDGTTPWYWFEKAGYQFLYAGENLAVNFSDSSDVDRAWMNSPGHRANILNGKFTEIGIATAKGMYNGRETIFVVEMFGKPLPAFAKKVLPSSKGSLPQKGVTTPTSTPQMGTLKTLSGTTSSTTVLKIPSNPQRVLGENENFFSLKIDDILSYEESSSYDSGASVSRATTLAGEILTSPKKIVGVLYLTLGVFVLVSLLLLIFVEIRRQHIGMIFLGIGLLLLIVILSFIYREFIFNQVIVL